MVVHLPSKQGTRVQFPYPAQNKFIYFELESNDWSDVFFERKIPRGQVLRSKFYDGKI